MSEQLLEVSVLEYKVIIGNNAIDDLSKKLSMFPKASQVRLVSDENIAPLYAQQVSDIIIKAGLHCKLDVVAAGEESKSISTWQYLMNRWVEDHVNRNDVVIALGGGVVGDLAGFASSTYERGIDYIQIPTTLLAAVDSSVGGKTALNLPGGKNLIGSFHQPKAVICDTSFLHSVPLKSWTDGVAEMIKYGILADPDLFEELNNNLCLPNSPNLNHLIATCVKHKDRFVAKDTKDKGIRQQLNLGHTIGHAIEILSDFSISHGHAVAIGLSHISKCAFKENSCSYETHQSIINTLKNNNLPISTTYRSKEITESIYKDKKADKNGVTFVLPERIGLCSLKHIDYTHLESFISLGGS